MSIQSSWLTAASLIAAVTLASPAAADPPEPEEFDELEIFFEFNATDLDLGLQGFLDAPPWRWLEATGPDGKVFKIKAHGQLGVLGITEFDFEGAEPPLVEDPDTATDEEIEAAVEAFLAMFPEGDYIFEGQTVEGAELYGVAELTHDLADEPDLDLDAFPVVTWVPDPDCVDYEVVVEAEVVTLEDGEEEERTFVNTATVDGTATNVFTASPDFLNMLAVLEAGGAEVELKVELICREESGNKTSTEDDIGEED